MTDRNKINVYIASSDYTEVDISALKSIGYQIIGFAADGESALKEILECRPDVVISDVFLTGVDALGILEMLNSRAFRGMFICTSNVKNDAMASQLMTKGAAYFLVRPFSYDYLAKRIDSLMSEKSNPLVSALPNVSDNFDLESCISDLMCQIGVPAHIRGYKYIRKSILLSLENSELLNAITKELYPTVASVYKTTPSRVERAIRHAIEVAWSRGDVEVLNTIFGYTIKTSKGKPTNGEFISMLTDRLRLNLKIA